MARAALEGMRSVDLSQTVPVWRAGDRTSPGFAETPDGGGSSRHDRFPTPRPLAAPASPSGGELALLREQNDLLKKLLASAQENTEAVKGVGPSVDRSTRNNLKNDPGYREAMEGNLNASLERDLFERG